MRCVYCGKETEDRLCDEYKTVEVLDELLTMVDRYEPERCGNPHVSAYVESFDPWSDAYAVDFPNVLKLFPDDAIEYERCFYLGDKRKDDFAEAAHAYLSTHGWAGEHSQTIMHLLLQTYNRKDFNSPIPYVDFIAETDGLCHELYISAINYMGMTGDYDDAAELIDYAKGLAQSGGISRIGKSAETQLAALEDARRNCRCGVQRRQCYEPQHENQ